MKKITITLRKDQLDRLDRKVSTMQYMTRSKFVRKLIEDAV